MFLHASKLYKMGKKAENGNCWWPHEYVIIVILIENEYNNDCMFNVHGLFSISDE